MSITSFSADYTFQIARLEVMEDLAIGHKFGWADEKDKPDLHSFMPQNDTLVSFFSGIDMTDYRDFPRDEYPVYSTGNFSGKGGGNFVTFFSELDRSDPSSGSFSFTTEWTDDFDFQQWWFLCEQVMVPELIHSRRDVFSVSVRQPNWDLSEVFFRPLARRISRKIDADAVLIGHQQMRPHEYVCVIAFPKALTADQRKSFTHWFNNDFKPSRAVFEKWEKTGICRPERLLNERLITLNVSADTHDFVEFSLKWNMGAVSNLV